MPWYTLGLGKRKQAAALTAAAVTGPPALTAAAAAPKGPQPQFLRHTEKWQNEVWEFYDTLGEFNYGIWWLSNMLSRVRLRAAKLRPGSDEPDITDKGTAAELMMKFGGGVTGQAQIMKRITVQLSLPGEGYVIGEEINGQEKWQVRSVDEIKSQSGSYQLMDENSVTTGQEWRQISDNSLVFRVWRPHDRYYHLADSPARSAREIMRELELVNRHIVAQYLSRLASAGIILFPAEMDFPVREEFADAPNPFMREWIEIAAEAIKTPGTAAGVIPIPIQLDSEVLDKVKLIDFTLKIDEKIIDKRESAIKRLATKLDMPAEILLGMGDVNHWGAWQLEEGALKTHVAPVAELICQAFTESYLQPRLRASGEDDADQWVVWYDMSELALRPDRSGNATEAYDRLELSGSAYRRELGFDEDDKPTDDDLVEQALKVIIHTLPSGAASALAQLTGQDIAPVVPVSPQDPGTADAVQKGDIPEPDRPAEQAPPESKNQPANGPPNDGDAPSQDDAEARTAARLQRSMAQARTQHVIRFGSSNRWELLHPDICRGHAFGCPFTHAVSSAAPSATPGTTGNYLCHLDALGLLVIDGSSPYLDTSKMISTSLLPVVRRNGHART